MIEIAACQAAHLPGAIAIWNEVVEAGQAFPQLEALDLESGRAFFAAQSFTGIAVDSVSGAVCGLYILHPNNVGRCG
ncbi:MAG TPA: GNAT family N-acetyltransferase, partial [Candidatus Aphodomorpha intestinavium]|nr:GNAT family N-acetyltransferase [Candidatus Aphodomorpha intestinavium]